ncbi:hypothetical protein EU537_08700 [Candidatus Thorarchaeota archaeon]|nr:MAG: hypothetical protein EU537_08700 [Candidatus Thorarchaeota archaeon]
MQLDFIPFLGTFGTIALLMVVISFIITALLLGVALGPVNGRNRELGSTVVTALLMALSNLAIIVPVIGPILSCILQWYFIKSRHEVGWGGAIVAWIVLIILQVIVLIVIIMLLGGGLNLLFDLIPMTP